MSAYLNLTGSIVVPLRAAADDAPLFNLTDPRPSGEVDLTASVVVLVVIAGLPLQLWLIHCLWLSRRPSQACGWDMSERRSRDEAQLLERLSTARRAEQQVRARVTFGSLAVAWACEIVAWGPLTVSWATGVSEADFYARSGIPLPVYGIPAALGPALVLLACRPLDHIGVRLAGAFCGELPLLLRDRHSRLPRGRLARRRRLGLGSARDRAACAAALWDLCRLARLGKVMSESCYSPTAYWLLLPRVDRA